MSESYSQTNVLDDVRRALGRRNTTIPVPLEKFSVPESQVESGSVLDNFVAEARSLGCKIHQASDAETIASVVAEICKEAGVNEVVLADGRSLRDLNLESALQRHAISINGISEMRGRSKEDLVPQLAKQRVGITAVDFAIGETGTIVLTSDEDQALLVSLLPPIHIAVLRTEQIVQSLSTVIERLQTEYMGREEPCRSATFISGPSRTSDVELTLSIGVHGPKELHLLMLEKLGAMR